MPFEARIDIDELTVQLDDLRELDVEERSSEQEEELERLVNLQDEIGYEWNLGGTLVHESELESIASDTIAQYDLPGFVSDAIDSEVVAERIASAWTEVMYGNECYYIEPA